MKKLLAALLGLTVSASAFAQASAVPNLMSYQSRVADAAGVPLGNTSPVNRIVLFRIYDSPNLSAPANRLYSEQQTVTISGGEFSVLIGSGTAISTESSNAFSTLSAAVFGGATRYLGVTIDDGDGNPFNDPELSPRQQIVGTPFAFRAQVAEAVAAGGVSATSLANNSVGTAALAAGAITSDKLAANAVGSAQIVAGSVGTAQVADAAVTATKIATDAIDGSKIVDGSIGLADLNPSVMATLPKPSTVYNQGLGAFTRTGNQQGHQWLLFPIDANDLGVDGEVLISYQGAAKSGTTIANVFGGNYSANFSPSAPPVFSGQVRIITPTFGGGSTAGLAASITFNSSSTINFSNSTAAAAMPTSNIPFIATHQGMGPTTSYSVSGLFAPTSTTNGNTLFIAGAEPVPLSGSAPIYLGFPKGITGFRVTNYDAGSTATFSANLMTSIGYGTVSYFQAPSAFSNQSFQAGNGSGVFAVSNSMPLAAAVSVSSAVGTTGGLGTTPIKDFVTYPLLYIFNYYPGGILAATTLTNFDILNAATTTGSAGPAQTLTVSSFQVGTNKLTITVPNAHVVQVGDTVVLSGVTGTPAINASYTVSAVPSSTSFEIPATGATGPYTGGTITHTPTYNKFRLWVAVHSTVNARVIVSDK